MIVNSNVQLVVETAACSRSTDDEGEEASDSEDNDK
jgi:hypothetical protein